MDFIELRIHLAEDRDRSSLLNAINFFDPVEKKSNCLKYATTSKSSIFMHVHKLS